MRGVGIVLLGLFWFGSVALAGDPAATAQPGAGSDLAQLQSLTAQLRAAAAMAEGPWINAYPRGTVDQRKSAEQVVADIDGWILRKPAREQFGVNDENRYRLAVEQHALVVKHREALVQFFGKLRGDGSRSTEFVYPDGAIPVTFPRDGNAQMILITGVATGKTLDTRSLTGKERAAEIISEMIVPSLHALNGAFAQTDLDGYGMLVAYGSRDFSEMDRSSAQFGSKPEYVALIVPKALGKQYADGGITEGDLVRRASIYACDRDMRGDFKQITVRLK